MRLLRNPYYLMAGVYLALDVLALAAMALVSADVIAPIPALLWIRIHLLTIGVVVQIILGALPGIVASRLGAEPPGRMMSAVLWLLVNASFVLLLYSMPLGMSLMAAIGAAGIFLAIVLMLATVHRRGACPPFGRRAGALLFIAGPLFFLFGIYMAVSILLHWPAPGGVFGEIEGHVHANVWGFLALVVAGYLLERIPAAIGRPLRWPRLTPAISWLLIAGAFGLVAGPWLGILPLTMAGIAIYVSGTALLLANLAATALAGYRWTANIGHLLIAYLWMIVPAIVAPVILALTGKLPTGPIEGAAVSGLVAGWVLQIVLGALPLRLREIGHHASGYDGSWVSVVLLNLGALLIWISAFITSPDMTTSLTVAGYALVVVACVRPLAAILLLLLRRPGGGASNQPPAELSVPV